VKVDVRVVAATNRALDEAVRSGAFRPDLFYRLNVVRIHLPALRDHKADIPALAARFIRDLNRRFGRRVRHVTPEALDALLAYDFPGNVRELQNVLERAYALGARDEISPTDLPVFDARRTPPPLSELPTLAEAERELIVRALNLHADDKHRAARALGMSRRTLYRRLREYRLL
jgi:transcriptional regulator with PAS, ATPase and Fis domain